MVDDNDDNNMEEAPSKSGTQPPAENNTVMVDDTDHNMVVMKEESGTTTKPSEQKDQKEGPAAALDAAAAVPFSSSSASTEGSTKPKPTPGDEAPQKTEDEEQVPVVKPTERSLASSITSASATANEWLAIKERAAHRREATNEGPTNSAVGSLTSSIASTSATANEWLAIKQRAAHRREATNEGPTSSAVGSLTSSIASTSATANEWLAIKQRAAHRREATNEGPTSSAVGSLTSSITSTSATANEWLAIKERREATEEGPSISAVGSISGMAKALDGSLRSTSPTSFSMEAMEEDDPTRNNGIPSESVQHLVESGFQTNQGLAVAAPVKEENLTVAEEFHADVDVAAQQPPERKRSTKVVALIVVVAACTVAAIIVGVTLASRRRDESDASALDTMDYNRAELTSRFAPESIASSPEAFELALEWFSNQDPVELEPEDQRFVQRFVLGWLWFHSTNNGNNPWTTCNPPNLQKGEDDSCVFHATTRIHYDGSEDYEEVNSTRWLTGTHECDNWPGITCDANATLAWRLNFISNGFFHGEFPLFLQELKHMESLTIAFQKNLVGKLPSAVANMQQLWEFVVNTGSLSGQIPDSIYSMTNLLILNLGWNLLTGTLSPDIGQLGENLEELHLASNAFTGPMPETLGNLTKLEYLRLEESGYTGTIPKALGDLTDLKLLYMYENSLEGSIPEEFSNLVSIEEFRPYGNQLTGPLPDSLPWPNATRLFLQSNQLNGTIPVDLYQMSKLEFLHLADNEFTGPLDSMLGYWTNIIAVAVDNNMLTGRIPSELALLPNLSVVKLQNNQFDGDVPIDICSLPLLQLLEADCIGQSDEDINSCSCCTMCCDRVNRTCEEST